MTQTVIKNDAVLWYLNDTRFLNMADATRKSTEGPAIGSSRSADDSASGNFFLCSLIERDESREMLEEPE